MEITARLLKRGKELTFGRAVDEETVKRVCEFRARVFSQEGIYNNVNSDEDLWDSPSNPDSPRQNYLLYVRHGERIVGTLKLAGDRVVRPTLPIWDLKWQGGTLSETVKAYRDHLKMPKTQAGGLAVDSSDWRLDGMVLETLLVGAWGIVTEKNLAPILVCSKPDKTHLYVKRLGAVKLGSGNFYYNPSVSLDMKPADILHISKDNLDSVMETRYGARGWKAIGDRSNSEIAASRFKY